MKNDLHAFRRELLRDALSIQRVIRYILPLEEDSGSITANTVRRMETDSFFRFLRHPQVYDLLIAAARCRLMSILAELTCSSSAKVEANSPATLENDAPALLDEARICCLRVLSDHFSGVDPALFNLFWTAVPAGLSADLPRRLQQKDSVLLKELWNLTQLSVRERLLQTMEQLQRSFLPEEPAFQAILIKYRKSLQAYHEKGFIYLLGEYRFNEFYIPPTLIASSRWAQHTFRLTGKSSAYWTSIFSQERIIYIVGAPGSGKSLFCKNMIINYDQLEFPRSREYLMIYCDMKTYYTNGSSNRKSVPDFLRESIINATGMDGGEITLDFIRYYLRMGRCLVLMDALDEVPKKDRLSLHKKIINYFSSVNLSNKVCITSRARGFLPQNQIEVFSIAPLSNQNISDYIDRMIALGKFKQVDKEPFLQHSEPLIKKNFLTSFLVLSLLVNIYKAERELPENKIELYKKCFEYIAKKRENEKSRSNYDWPKLLALLKDSTFISLATLAAPNNANIPRAKIETMLLDQYRYKYTDEATAEQAVRDFLEFCGDRTELLVPAAEEDTFRFFHRSFFEYFYARHILQQNGVENMYHLMVQFDPDSEIFELVVALVKEENEKKYQDLLLHLFQQAEAELHVGHLTAFHILTLSMQVVDDAAFINRYFTLVLDSPTLLENRQSSSLNHELIAAWLRRAMAASPERRDSFVQTYRRPCLIYLLKLLGTLYEFRSLSKHEFHSLSIGTNTSAPPHYLRPWDIAQVITDFKTQRFSVRQADALIPSSSFLLDRLPFYLLAHPTPNALLTGLRSWDQEQRLHFLAKISSKQRNKLQQGFKWLDSSPHGKDIPWESLLQNFPTT